MSWNTGAQRIFGYSAEEIVGHSITLLLPADRLEEEGRILEKLQRGERVDHYETVRRRKDGTLIDVSLTISPIRDETGQVVGASKIARNITEQKESLRKLAQAHEQLKRADTMKAEFLATLSHELRTPLNAILGWVQILKEGATAEDLAEGVPVIERNVRAQAQLIEDLLDMSAIEAGKVSLDMRPVDLEEIARASLETVQAAAQGKEIRLTSAFSSLGGIVTGDRNRLQQILWNLLINAVKFTPKGGRVHVVIERCNSHVDISISDNGQGIALEFLPYVFDRFRQADPSSTRRHGGLGIGLSIAKHLTELHGGGVRVASGGVGKGATFTVSLPLQSVRHVPEELAQTQRYVEMDEAAMPADLQGVKVLVVDDERDSLEIVKRILGHAGAEVRTAASMEEGLAEFAQFLPDIVLSDIGMPGHDGYEFLVAPGLLPSSFILLTFL